MNERIKELAEQALRETVCIDGVYRPKGYSVHASKTFADKFAELIIKECIEQCQGNANAMRIAEHFGVEE